MWWLFLEDIIAETGIQPTFVRCDNGPEFPADALVDWCNTVGVSTAFIDPGSPWQNGLSESFNAQFRREQLSGKLDTMWWKRSIWLMNGKTFTIMSVPMGLWMG